MFFRFINILLLWICCYPVPTFAAVKVPVSDCDTLITTGGQVLLVHFVPCKKESIVRFSHCGDNNEKMVEVERSMIREIRRARVLSLELPDGSEPVVQKGAIPVSLQQPDDAKAEKKTLTFWSKMAAIGGFGSLFMIFFSIAFNSVLGITVLPLSIMGLVFALKVLRRTKNKPEYKKHRQMSKWSMAMSLLWLGLLILYIIIIIAVLISFI
jgi:hypothetical protein